MSKYRITVAGNLINDYDKGDVLAEATVNMPDDMPTVGERACLMVAATVVGNWTDGMGAVVGRLNEISVKADDEADEEGAGA